VLDLGDGPVALPAVEIVARDGVYDYAARYTAGVTTWHAPARLSSVVADRLAQVAVEAHLALGLGDMSRIDVMVGADGEPQVLGASVAPGMTDTSLLPMAIAAAGLDLGKTLAALVSRAVDRHAA
jgi:D-alanine-D-alanine ligase